MILRPLANMEISITKRPATQSNRDLPNRRYGPVGALVILAVAIGIGLVLLVEWLNAWVE